MIHLIKSNLKLWKLKSNKIIKIAKYVANK
jgi:hypothetical protein